MNFNAFFEQRINIGSAYCASFPSVPRNRWIRVSTKKYNSFRIPPKLRT
jgi:hypothetical protein